MEIRTAYLSLGSNIGDKFHTLSKAIQFINSKAGNVVAISSIYETEALGFEADELFNNCCVEIETKLSPIELLHINQTIEKTLGRAKTKEGEYESRKIDIDIIFYQNEIIDTEELTIPHLHFRNRNFVLFPLEEIAPLILDPITQLTISQLKENSPDSTWIKRIFTQISKKK